MNKKLNVRKLVKGEWKIFLPGDENGILESVKGTGWCLEDEETVRQLLGYEFYGENYKLNQNNKASVRLFFVDELNSDTKKQISNVRIAICVNGEGIVKKVLGLEAKNTIVEGYLFPMLEAEVSMLNIDPAILTQLNHQKKLVAILNKISIDQPLEKAELEFLYETIDCINLGINTSQDERVYAARNFALDQAKELGVLSDSQELMLEYVYGESFGQPSCLGLLSEHIVDFIEANCNVNLALMHLKNILERFQMLRLLKSDPVDKSLLIDASTSAAILDNIDAIIYLGEWRVVDKAATRLPEEFLAENIEEFLNLGVKPNTLLQRLSSNSVAKNFKIFLKFGLKVDDIISYLNPKTIVKNLDKLTNRGANPCETIRHLTSKDIIENISFFRKQRVSEAAIVANLSDEFIHKSYHELCQQYGIDANLLVPRLNRQDVSDNLWFFLKYGVTMSTLEAKLPTFELISKKDIFLLFGWEPGTQNWIENLEKDFLNSKNEWEKNEHTEF